jgi:GlpG protein
MTDQRRPLLVIAQASPVTSVLIGISAVVALVSGIGTDLHVLTWLTFCDLRGTDDSIAGGFADIAHGQVWRLITPIFIHFGFLHILFNMLWLWDLGGAIERRWSPRTLLALVLAVAVAANIAQFCVNWDLRTGVAYANALSGGMSGVVYGLLGYLWMRGRRDPGAGIRLNQQTVLMMMAWLVICCTGYLGHIGNSAHISGLLVGTAWGWTGHSRR